MLSPMNPRRGSSGGWKFPFEASAKNTLWCKLAAHVEEIDLFFGRSESYGAGTCRLETMLEYPLSSLLVLTAVVA